MTTWVVRLMTEIRVDVKGEEKGLVGSWILTTRQPHRVTLVKTIKGNEVLRQSRTVETLTGPKAG